jgi:hypothetical protein
MGISVTPDGRGKEASDGDFGAPRKLCVGRGVAFLVLLL